MRRSKRTGASVQPAPGVGGSVESTGRGPKKLAKVIRFMPYVLDALRKLGGSAGLPEVYDLVARLADVSTEELQKEDKEGDSVFKKDVRFARQTLVFGKLIDDAETGVWRLTPEGLAKDLLTHEEAQRIRKAHVASKKGPPRQSSRKSSQKNPVSPPPAPKAAYTKADARADLFMEEADLDRIMAHWRRKKNLILQGAPGTGKTFIARRLAYLLMEEKDEARVQMVQFHQSSSYEDFIQGIRPDPDSGGFRVQDGVFHRFCRRAAERPGERHVFVIDEINRGNLSKVFGELMMLIEPDKRGPEFAMPLSYARNDDEPFYVPENVYLIGTMNTADRSLSLVDYALRRRFGFWEMQPGFSTEAFTDTLSRAGASNSLLRAIRGRMERLNGMIAEDRNNLGSGYRIGHSFFVPAVGTVPDAAWLEDIIAHEILPLVEEYWVDDESKRTEARKILMEAF